MTEQDRSERLLQAFVAKHGIHQDELDNYNSHLPVIINLCKEHIKIEVEHDGLLHRIVVLNCYFVLPWERKLGMDQIEQAMLRNNYTFQVRGDLCYHVLRVPSSQNQVGLGGVPLEFMSSSIQNNDHKNESIDFMIPEADDIKQDEPYEEDVAEAEAEAVLNEHEADTGLAAPFLISKQNYNKYTEIIHHAMLSNHFILEFPVFLRSDMCVTRTPICDPQTFLHNYMTGCMFVVSRNLKVCPSEESIINNRVLNKFANGHLCTEMRSKFYHISRYGRTNSTLTFRVRNEKSKKFPIFEMEVPYEQKPKVYIPIVIMALAFGSTPSDLVRNTLMFIPPKYRSHPVIPSLVRLLVASVDSENCHTQSDAFQYIADRLKRCRSMKEKMQSQAEINSYIAYTLHMEYFPNVSDRNQDEESPHADFSYENARKTVILGCHAANLMLRTQRIYDSVPFDERYEVDDKRSYVLKRLDTPGNHMVRLSRQYLKGRVVRDGTKKLRHMLTEKKRIDMSVIFNRQDMSVTSCIKSGVFDIRNIPSDSNRNKTHALTNGLNSDSVHVQVSKINKYESKHKNDVDTMLTHPTQNGRVDAYKTPESEKCCIIRFKAMGCTVAPFISLDRIMNDVMKILRQCQHQVGLTFFEHRVPGVEPEDGLVLMDVFGGILGWVTQPIKLYQLLVQHRRRGTIYRFLSFEVNERHNIFYLNADEGRMMAPRLIRSELPRLWSIVDSYMFQHLPNPVSYLVTQGVLEYLDAAEEYCGQVVLGPDPHLHDVHASVTHFDVHPLLNYCAIMCQSFFNHDAATRRMYAANMETRVISMKALPDRGATCSMSLIYGQKPLQSNPVDPALSLRRKEPDGINCVVAVCMDESMEDCITIKKSACERGMGVTMETSSFTIPISPMAIFAKPKTPCRGMASEDKYAHLDNNGIPIVGRKMVRHAAIVGQVLQSKSNSAEDQRCMSPFMTEDHIYTVSSVDVWPDPSSMKYGLTEDVYQPKIIRVGVTHMHYPTQGDKACFGHGQKATFNVIKHDVDLPFTDEGIIPDVLFNTVSFLRMTVGLMLESYQAKVRIFTPMEITQYRTVLLSNADLNIRMTTAVKVLSKLGYHYSGKEFMTDGCSGRRIQYALFNGVMHMRILKQIAQGKIRSRNQGPLNELTRQPIPGKRKGGGVQYGEMELWNVECVGGAELFRNMIHVSADKFEIVWCTLCECQAVGDLVKGWFNCLGCRSRLNLVRLSIPYISNLMQQETLVMGLGHRFITGEPEYPSPVDETAIFYQAQKDSLKINPS